MTIGMALGTVGLVLLAMVDASSGYGLLFPGYLLFGLALGFVYAPMSTAAMTAMPAQKAGIAAGVLAMNRVLSGALTLAVAGAVFQHLLIEDGKTQSPSSAYTSALSGAMWVLVGLCAIGTVLTWAFVRTSGDPDAVPPERWSTTSIIAGSTCLRPGAQALSATGRCGLGAHERRRRRRRVRAATARIPALSCLGGV